MNREHYVTETETGQVLTEIWPDEVTVSVRADENSTWILVGRHRRTRRG